MKLHKPLFSIIIIFIQFIITAISYISFQSWFKKQNPDSLISFGWSGSKLFLAVLIIALFEMTSSNNFIKNIVQTLLVFIIFIQIGPNDIRNDFCHLMSETTLLLALIALILLLIKFLR